MKKVAVLFSGSASSVLYLIKNDSNYGKLYTFVGAVSNKRDVQGIQLFQSQNIPCRVHNTKSFCIRRGYTGKLKDMPDEIRQAYFQVILEEIALFDPDLVLLSGFMLEITPPLLGFMPIINVHPADLRVLDIEGKPKYRGMDVVRLAIESGEEATCSTIHVVEKNVDCGRIITVSDPLPYVLGTLPEEHQEKMKTLCDGPAYRDALSQICSGEFVL